MTQFTSLPSISILMGVYKLDNPYFLEKALDSFLEEIELIEETILCIDGPLTHELHDVINKRIETHKINCVTSKINVGLGEVLNLGMKVVKSDFVLRMDADDLCKSNRIQNTIETLSKHNSVDVLGSFINEFNEDPLKPKFVRQVPLTHSQILKSMRFMSPINHVTAAIRTKKLIEVGGYEGGKHFAEDWWLWIKLAKHNAKFMNINSITVDVRIGNGFISRRTGKNAFMMDLRLINKMRSIKFGNFFTYMYLIVFKLLQRFLPNHIVALGYWLVRKKH